MNPLIESIYAAGKVVGRSGREIVLNSTLGPADGAFLHRIISEDASVCRTLEVGCALGMSTLHICDALQSRSGRRHTAIDPFQRTQWDGVGIANVERAGFSFFDLIEQRSEFALPELLADGEVFDLIFIDGWHTFDHTLLDAFYATRLLRTGGYLLIDDAGMGPVRRACDYLASYPCYRKHAAAGRPAEASLRRRAARKALSLVPARVRAEVFHPSLLARIFLEDHIRILAFRKIGEDERSWDWFPEHF